MRLTVQKEAAEWYRDELGLDTDSSIRFFVRYGGTGGIQPGFSLGVRPDEPDEPFAETKTGEFYFFIEKGDAWYFEGVNLDVVYNEQADEPEFVYSNIK